MFCIIGHVIMQEKTFIPDIANLSKPRPSYILHLYIHQTISSRVFRLIVIPLLLSHHINRF